MYCLLEDVLVDGSIICITLRIHIAMNFCVVRLLKGLRVKDLSVLCTQVKI